jgi:hypothetical protein
MILRQKKILESKNYRKCVCLFCCLGSWVHKKIETNCKHLRIQLVSKPLPQTLHTFLTHKETLKQETGGVHEFYEVQLREKQKSYWEKK